jgi:hypothetical protein
MLVPIKTTDAPSLDAIIRRAGCMGRAVCPAAPSEWREDYNPAQLRLQPA